MADTLKPVQDYRQWHIGQFGIDDPRGDDDIIWDIGSKAREQGDFSIETSDPTFRDRFLQLRRDRSPGIIDELGGRFERGGRAGIGSLAGLGQMAVELYGGEGSSPGFEEFRQRQLQEAAEIPVAVERFEDIQGPRDFMRFLSGTAVEQIPIVGSTIAGSLVGGAIGGGLPGAAIGGGIVASGSYIGQIYGTARDQGAQVGDAAFSSVIAGIPAGLVSVVMPARVSGLLQGTIAGSTIKNSALRALREAGISTVLEGTAEGIAEAFVVEGERMAIPGYEITPEQYRSRILNAAAAGAGVGGLTGLITGTITKPSPTVEDVYDAVADIMAKESNNPQYAVENRQLVERIGNTIAENSRRLRIDPDQIRREIDRQIRAQESVVTEAAQETVQQAETVTQEQVQRVQESVAAEIVTDTPVIPDDYSGVATMVNPDGESQQVRVEGLAESVEGVRMFSVEGMTEPVAEKDLRIPVSEVVATESPSGDQLVDTGTELRQANERLSEIDSRVKEIDSVLNVRRENPTQEQKNEVSRLSDERLRLSLERGRISSQLNDAPRGRTVERRDGQTQSTEVRGEQDPTLTTQTQERTGQRDGVIGSRTATDGAVNALFSRLIIVAGRLGLNITLVPPSSDQTSMFYQTEGGVYRPTNRSIVLAMENVLEPSMQNVVTLLHEVGHDMFRNAPAAVQTAILNMIGKMERGDFRSATDPLARDSRIAIENPQGMVDSILREELFVEDLALQNVDRDVATGIVSSFIRAVVDLLTRAALQVQQAILGPNATSDFLARAYAMNRMAMFLAGDPPAFSFLSFISGKKPVPGQILRSLGNMDGDGTFLEMMDYTNQEWVIQDAIPDSMEAIEFNILKAGRQFDTTVANLGLSAQVEGEAMLNEAANAVRDEVGARATVRDTGAASRVEGLRQKAIRQTISDAQKEVAVQNRFAAIVDSIVEKILAENPDRTRAAILKDLGISDPREMAARAYQLGVTQLAQIQDGLELGFDSNTTIADLPTPAARSMANKSFAMLLTRQSSRMASMVSRNAKSIAQKSATLDAKSKRFTELSESVADIKATERELRSGIIASLRKLARDIGRQSDVSEDFGGALAIMRLLDSRLNDVIPPQYQRLLSRINIRDFPLYSFVSELMNLTTQDGRPIDLIDTPLQDIRNAVIERVNQLAVEEGGEGSVLEALLAGRGEPFSRGSAILSAVIDFVRHNQETLAAMQAQHLTQSERSQVLQSLRNTMREATESNIDSMIDQAKRLAPTSARDQIIYRFLQAKRELMNTKRNIRDAERRLEALSSSRELVNNAFDDISKELGVNFNWDFAHDQELFVPPNPEATPEEVMANRKKIKLFRAGRVPATTQAELMQWQHSIKNWLGQNSATPVEGTALYNWLSLVEKKIATNIINESLGASNRGLFGNFFRDIGTSLRRSQTQGGTVAARMWSRFVAISQAEEARSSLLGSLWGEADSNVRGIMKMTVSEFNTHIYNPALNWLSQERVLEGDAAFDALVEYLHDDPIARNAINREGAKKALRDFLEIHYQNVEYFYVELAGRLDNFVRDERITWKNPLTGASMPILRDGINRGVVMTPRGISDATFKTVLDLADAFVDPRYGLDPKGQTIAEIYSADPEAYRRILDSLFWKEGQRNQAFTLFLEPLVLNDSGIIFRWRDENGNRLTPSPDVVERAWNESNGNLVTFAENLHTLMGGTPDTVADTVQSVVGKVFSYNRRLASLKASGDKTSSEYNLPHVGIDSRVAEDFPSQWLQHETYTKQDNYNRVNKMAANSAFGRDLAALQKAMTDMQKEIEFLAAEYLSEKELIEARNPEIKGKSRAIRRELIKKLGREKYIRLHEASISNQKGSFSAKKYMTQSKSILSKGKVTEDFGAFEVMMGFIYTGLTMGLKTALKNYSSPFVDTFLFTGTISRYNILRPFFNVGLSFRGLGNAMASMFALQMFRASEGMLVLNEAGAMDYESRITLKQRRTDPGPSREFDTALEREGLERIAPRWKRAMRLVSQAVSHTTLNRSQVQGIDPAPRLSPFPFSQLHTNMISSYSILKEYEALINRVIKYIEENPDATEADITAQNLGIQDVKFLGLTIFDDSLYIDAMKRRAAEFGFGGLRAMAQKAKQRKDSGQYMFDREDGAKFWHIGRTEISLESSAVSRPAALQTTVVGRQSGGLLGWSVQKALRAIDVMSGKRGSEDGITMRRLVQGDVTLGQIQAAVAGMKAMMFAMMPISMIYALFFDWYDEDVLGKKSNLRPFTPEAGLDEMAMAAMERMANLGTFGFLGEGVNSAMNMGDGKALLSFDERVVWANTIRQIQTLTSSAVAVEAWKDPTQLTYAGFWRQLFSTLGGTGLLHNFQVMNNLLGINNAESRVNERINVNNYLRAAGRTLQLDVRTFGGGYSRPTPVTPHLTSMGIAAINDDKEGFKRSYENALRVAMRTREETKTEAADYLKRSFQSRHPLRTVFRTPPSEDEYQNILGTLNPAGRRAVEDAVRNYNKYAQSLGIRPYLGRTPRGGGGDSGEGSGRSGQVREGAGRSRVDSGRFGEDSPTGLPSREEELRSIYGF